MIPDKYKRDKYPPHSSPISHTFMWGVNRITVVGARRSDVVFSHEDPQIQTVNISLLQEHIKKRKVRFKRIMADMTKESTEIMLKDRDIDPKRVEWFKVHREALNEPVIFVGELPDCILIDGTHRVYTHYSLGNLHIRSYIISYKVIQRYRIQFWINGVLAKDTRESIMRGYQYGSPLLGEVEQK